MGIILPPDTDTDATSPEGMARAIPRSALTPGLVERFRAGHNAGPPKWCWHWQGYRNVLDYGYLYAPASEGKRKFLAHRLSWVFYCRYPLEAGLTVDHLCYVTSCVNPFHLEPVTYRENSERAARRRAALRQGHI